ncbi:MAG: hypothetical protein ACRDYA_05745 [Egibacteraceae bacterium]
MGTALNVLTDRHVRPKLTSALRVLAGRSARCAGRQSTAAIRMLRRQTGSYSSPNRLGQQSHGSSDS